MPATPTVKLDPKRVQSSADGLYSAVEQAVSAAGGNLAEQHLNLAIGFSTGHFASNPGMAEAARAITTALVDAHLVQGDTVRAYAWEMNVWPHRGSTLNPFLVPGSAPGSPGKSDVNRLWPRSTQNGSQGGHDTERAAVEMAQTLAPADGSVMVLLTNTAYSIASKTQKPIGDSDPEFTALLTSFKRLPAQNSSGASVALPFTELTTGRERSLDAVILVPTAYQAAPLDAPRGTLLAGAADAAPPGPSRPLWPWILVGLAALGGAAYFLLRPRPGSPSGKVPSRKGGAALGLDVEGQPFVLATAPAKPLSIRLVRQGYAAADERTAVLGDSRLPTVLATLEQVKQGFEIKPEKNVKLTAINGQPVTKLLVPLQAGSYRLDFKGTYQEKESLPPKPFLHTVRVRLTSAAPAPARSVPPK